MNTMPLKYHHIGDWRDPSNVVDRLRREAKAKPGTVIGATCGVWSVSYSIDDGDGCNIFSARVLGSTKERDWTILGRMAARIGAPEESTPETIRTAPDASHYWTWGGRESAEENAAHVQSVRGMFDGMPLTGLERPDEVVERLVQRAKNIS